MKFDKELQILLLSMLKQGEVLWLLKESMPTNKHSKINLSQLENGMKLYNWNTCTKPI
jgi:hypothetical protein